MLNYFKIIVKYKDARDNIVESTEEFTPPADAGDDIVRQKGYAHSAAAAILQGRLLFTPEPGVFINPNRIISIEIVKNPLPIEMPTDEQIKKVKSSRNRK